MSSRLRPHSLAILASVLLLRTVLAQEPGEAPDFQFDGGISRPVLENYLSRSISYTELLHDDLAASRNKRGVDPKDNLRFILGTKAKLIGRALMLWGRESSLPEFLSNAKSFAATLHQADPDILLQAAAFEIVTQDVGSIPVPEEVLKEFSQPVEARNFRYEEMLYADGKFVKHWGGNASVPDMSRVETRMWFYFLVSRYIDTGIEAIHFGQVGLMDKNDPGHAGWIDLLGRVRAYAKVTRGGTSFSATPTRRPADTWKTASCSSTFTPSRCASPRWLINR